MKPTSKEAYTRLMILKYVIVHALATPRPMLSDLFANWSETEKKAFDDACKQKADASVASLKEINLWKHASPKEQLFLQSFGSQMDEYEHRAATWRMECAAMIMWALGLLNSWPNIDEEINTDLLKSVPIQQLGFFSKHPDLRKHSEMAAKRDLIEFWHWRVRTRRLIEEGTQFEADDDMKRAGLNSYDDIIRFSARAANEKGDLPQLIDDDFVFLGKPFRSLSTDEYQLATSIIMERHFALNWLCGMAPGNRWDETPTDT
ncbi:MAG: DUF4272 domain-containing protein [Nitrospirota bacterium]|nr:DUF4272 domain-containing protein [Nitrospirota bacterium]